MRLHPLSKHSVYATEVDAMVSGIVGSKRWSRKLQFFRHTSANFWQQN